MKKIFLICNVLILLFVTVSCVNSEEIIYDYDGKTYTSDCQYGPLGLYWSFLNFDEMQWENITVHTKWGKEKARKIQGDESVDFIYIHDVICVREDLQLPNVEKNKEDILKIVITIHNELNNESVIIVDKNEIHHLSEQILESDSNTKSSKDYFYEYIGDIDIIYNDFPAAFSAGRILKDENGNLFLSSRINPCVKDKMFSSLYSIPFEIPS